LLETGEDNIVEKFNELTNPKTLELERLLWSRGVNCIPYIDPIVQVKVEELKDPIILSEGDGRMKFVSFYKKSKSVDKDLINTIINTVYINSLLVKTMLLSKGVYIKNIDFESINNYVLLETETQMQASTLN
jgi:hypothetical protein